MSLSVKVARASSQGGLSGPTQQGGLFSSIGSFLGTAAKTAVGFATGGIGGAVGASGILGRPGGVPVAPPGLPSFQVPGGARVGGLKGVAQRAIPGGATGYGTGCPSGYHPNKTAYFLQNGTHVPAGSKCVKNRRRNPMNPKALSRAIGRIEGGKRMAAKLSGITIRKSCKK